MKKELLSTKKLVEELKLTIVSSPDDDVKSRETELINKIQTSVEEDKKAYNGLNNLSFALLIILLGICLFWLYQNFIDNEYKEKVTITQSARNGYRDSLYNAIMEPRENGSVTYLMNDDGTIKSYRTLLAEMDSLRNKIYNTEMESYRLQSKISSLDYDKYLKDVELDLIKRQYSITVVSNDSQIYVKAPQIDSAMILLKVYRDKLKWDGEKKHWTITN